MSKVHLFLLALVAAFIPLSGSWAQLVVPLKEKGVVHLFDFKGNDGEPSARLVKDTIEPRVRMVPRGKRGFTYRPTSHDKSFGLVLGKQYAYGEIYHKHFSFTDLGTISVNLSLNACALPRAFGTIAARYSSTKNQRGFLFGVDEECRLVLLGSPDGKKGTVIVKSDIALKKERMTHVAVRLDGGGRYTFFVDGKKAGDGLLPGGVLRFFASTAPLSVGAASRSSLPGDMRLFGEIDDLIFVDHPLSAAEIERLHEHGEPN